MRCLNYIVFVSLFILVGCGGGGENPPEPSGSSNTVIDDSSSGSDTGENPDDTPITELPLAGQPGEVGDVDQEVGGEIVDEGEVLPTSFTNAEGNFRQNNVGEGNFTLGVTASDPDGLSEVILFVPSVNRNFVLCSDDCGNKFQVVLTGINPQLMGATPGSLSFELFVGDTLDNLVTVDSVNVNWQPIQISSISAIRSNNIITVNWAENASVIRYNLYAATEQGINNDNVLSLENGIQQLAIAGTSAQFNDEKPHKEYQVFLTGINSEGESGQSAIFTIPRSEGTTNQAPVANSDSYHSEEDIVISENVLVNDIDGNEQVLTLTDIIEFPVNGTVEFEASGQILYTPVINFVGEDHFIYQISDSEGALAQGSVDIYINGVNDHPIANNDSFIINLDNTLTISAAQLLENDTDVEGDTLTVLAELSSQPIFGDVVINTDGSFTYSANVDFVDSDSFIYQVSDGQGGVDQASVFLLLNTSNQPPIAQSNQYQINEDDTLIINTVADGILANDSDPNNRAFQLVTPLTALPLHGQLNVAEDGTFSYIPNSDFFGTDQFQYQIINSLGITAQATVSIDVIAQADAPITSNDNYQVNEDSVLNILQVEGVLENDSDLDLGTLTVNTIPVSDPSQGSLILQNDGSFSYTANANFTGVDSFSYQVSNESNLTSTSQVFISVSNINDAPVAGADSYSVDEDTTLNGSTVLVNDSDADGDSLTVNTTPVVNVSDGSLTLFTDGTFTYVPTANTNGNDSFTYSVTDNNGGTAQAVVALTINAVNDNPVAVTDSGSIDEDNILNGTTVLTNDSDIDGDTLTVNATPTSDVSNGSLILNSDGSFVYTPTAGFFGNDSFSYQVLDGQGGTATASVNLTVNSINDVPVAGADSYSVDEDTTLNGSTVLVNDSDADGDSLTVNTTPVVNVSNGNLTLLDNGTFTYLAAGDFNGADNFTYQVSDGQGGVSQAVVTITVNPINDAPSAVNDSYSIAENASLNISAVAANRLLINDSDVDNDTLTLSTTAINYVTNGSLTLNVDGSFIYTPTASYSGSDSFTYQITDSNAATAQATVNLTITNINDAPVATDDSYTMTNGFTLSAPTVLVNDTDLDADTLSIDTTPLALPSSGTLVLAADGTFNYTPIAMGVYNFTYQVNDGNGGSDTGQVTITVNTSNTAPVGNTDAYNIVENHVLNGISVLGNDTDVDGNSLSVNTTPVVTTSNGALTLNADGSFIYTPTADYVGSDTFTYELDDGNGATATAVVNLTISANTTPSAQNDSYNVDEDTTLNASTVLTNDTDAEGDTLTINTTAIVDVTNGALTINADGSFDYTPNADFVGTDTFTYQIDDGTGDTNQAIVTITVDPINDTPVANSDSYNTGEDVVLNGSTVLVNDTDIDGDSLTISTTAISTTVNGDLTLNSNGTFVYTPNLNFNGSDSFTYQLDDSNGGTAQAVVDITVNSGNDNPVVNDDSFTMSEDAVLVVNSVDAEKILANDSDADGDSLTVNTTPTIDVSHGSLVLSDDGGFTYTPNGNFFGVDSFDYQISDGQGGGDSGTVSITVVNLNDIPTTTDDAFNTDEDTPLNGTSILLNDSDVDGDSLSLITVPFTAPTNGNLTLSTNGIFTYTPNADFTGLDSFVYQVSDGVGGSNNGTVNITVNAINDAPVANIDSYNIAEDTVLNGSTVLVNDSDIDADTLSVNTTPTANVSNGSLSLSSDGTFVYTPNVNFNGSDSFTYQITDSNGGSDTAAVSITVTSVNDIPVAVNDSVSTTEDTVLNGTTVLINDSDIEGDTLTISATAITDATNGVLNLSSNGTYSYTPAANFNGEDSFVYQANDGNGGSAQGTVTITVEPENDDPVATIDSYTVNEDVVLTKLVTDGDQLLANDSDIDVSDTLSVNTTPLSDVTDGTLTLNGDGSFAYTPDVNFAGTDIFTYQITDGNGGSHQAQVTITVAMVNDAPTAVEQTFFVDEDKTDGYVVGTITASDIEGHNMSYAIIGGDGSLFNIDSASGSITLNGATPLNFESSTQHSLSIEIIDDGSPNEASVISATINVNNILEPVVPTELASFGRPSVGFLELTGEKENTKLTDSVRNGNEIYFVGYRENIDKDIYMVVYEKDGIIHDSFGINGTLTLDFGHHETVKAIAENGGKYYLAFESFNGVHTEICFIELNGNGDLDTSNGVNGVSCTDEKSDLAINDMVEVGSNFFVVGRKRGADDDLLIIQIDDKLIFSPHIILDVSGEGLDDEGLAAFEPESNKLLIAGSVSSIEGDIDTFAWLLDQDGNTVDTFNPDVVPAGSPRIYDINGFDDVVQSIGGKVESSFTAYLAGYTTLVDGEKEAAIIAIDNTGALSDSFTPSGVATFDAGGGSNWSEFTGIEYDGDLYLSGTLNDGQTKQFATKIKTTGGMVDSGNFANSTGGYQTIEYGSDESFALSASLDGDKSLWMPGYRQAGSDSSVIISAVDISGDLLAGHASGDFVSGQHTINYTSTPSDDSGVQVLKINNGTHAGKFMAVSIANDASINNIVLTRFTADGALDTSFDSDGHKQVHIGSDATAKGLIELSDGKLVLYGNVIENEAHGFIAKLDEDAIIDSSFATNGIYTTVGISADKIVFNQAAVDNNNSIVAVGELKNDSYFILRLNSTGSLDSSFSSNGYHSAEEVSVVYNSLAIDASNNIIIGGYRVASSRKKMQVSKYTNSGSFDSSFSGNGRRNVEVNASADDFVTRILVDSSSDIYLVGNDLATPNKVAVVKMSATGVLDTSFSGDGIASFVMAPSNSNATVNDAILDSEDNIIVIGSGEISGVNTPMIGRIKPDATLDSMFNTSGFFNATSCTNTAQLNSLLLLDDTNIVVAGHCYIDANFKNNLELTHYQLIEQ
jgi:uncharacterized delta-60 repeat protein